MRRRGRGGMGRGAGARRRRQRLSRGGGQAAVRRDGVLNGAGGVGAGRARATPRRLGQVQIEAQFEFLRVGILPQRHARPTATPFSIRCVGNDIAKGT